MQTPAVYPLDKMRRVVENPHYFQAWQKGEPVIHCRCGDAPAQRDGLMHNRLRMITASLVKDLLIDWRLGALLHVAAY